MQPAFLGGYFSLRHPTIVVLAPTRQLRFNPFGGPGSASWDIATDFYLLSHDSRVFRGRDLPDAPEGDVGRVDYDAARREAPGSYGT